MVRNCKKCGAEFTPQKGLKNYCSMSCRNSRTHSEETKKKISEGVKIKIEQDPKYLETVQATNRLESKRKQQRETWNKKLLARPFEELSYDSLRKRIILEQDGICNHCGLKEWQGKPIPLEMEHIDGDRHNNARDNLEAICPNCHAFTDTWRGRNNRIYSKRISDEQLMAALVEKDWNMRQALISVGMSPKGGNYVRCHRLKRIAQDDSLTDV